MWAGNEKQSNWSGLMSFLPVDIVLLLLIGLGETLANEMCKRIMVLDGAMGTMIQGHNLTEEQFRGKRRRSVLCLLI